MIMCAKDLSEYKRRYGIFRHHAWAGGILLSVLFALKYLFPEIPDVIFLPLASILVVYILVALFFTYKYRAGLSSRDEVVQVQPSVELEREKIQAKVEKERLKAEKKKAKAKAKKVKKTKD